MFDVFFFKFGEERLVFIYKMSYSKRPKTGSRKSTASFLGAELPGAKGQTKDCFQGVPVFQRKGMED